MHSDRFHKHNGQLDNGQAAATVLDRGTVNKRTPSCGRLACTDRDSCRRAARTTRNTVTNRSRPQR